VIAKTGLRGSAFPKVAVLTLEFKVSAVASNSLAIGVVTLRVWAAG
jgi:hypothetical protein